MRKKLRECQRARVMSYQHIGDYKEGDKVWFQQRDGNAWFGQSVWLHSQGNIKKVAACKMKPYKLGERESWILTRTRRAKMIK